MFDVQALMDGIALLTSNWQMPLIILSGMLIGLVMGVIPGLNSAIGITLLLPVSYTMQPFEALVLLTSVYTGGLTGGGITAILINTPGAPAAAATVFDGYPMTRQGKANEALGLQIASSVVGGLSGYVMLLLFIGPLVSLALRFGPAEMMFLTVFVLAMMGVMGGRSFSKTVFSGIFGIMLGTIGTSEETGVTRGTFGLIGLEDGIPQVVLIVGLFAIPELFNLVSRRAIVDSTITEANSARRIIEGAKSSFRYWKCMIRSAAIGVGVGALPAAGSAIAALLSYGQAKNSAKPGQKFGEGEPEGIVAAETANNASEGGAMAVLLALGLPGSASTAILIAAFMLHGLVPGQRLVVDNAPLVYGLIVANMFQMGFLFFCALGVALISARIVYVPSKLLAPSLLCVMAIGAFSVRYLYFDIYLLLFLGILGWFFNKYGFSVICLIIGCILGRRFELEYFRYETLFGNDPMVLIERPIAGFFAAMTVLFIVLQIRKIRQRGTRV